MYLIIGASSFIGKHLYDYCIKQNIDVLGTYYKHSYYKEWIRFNICTDDFRGTFCRYLDTGSPHVLIICAADSSIDHCKKNEKASNNLNVIGTKKIIRQANEMGIKCVFLSSETVFDGRKGMYAEEDVPNPITLYGRQKLLIEQYIVEYVKEYLIFRISRATGSAYGEKDIFDEFYHKIIRNEEIVCLKNQSFCLTEVNDIVQGIIKALDHDINGLYHLSSNNYVSRYTLAKLYSNKIFGRYEKVIEKEYADIVFLDARHIWGGLKGGKLASILGIHYMDIEEILNKYKYTYEKTKSCDLLE